MHVQKIEFQNSEAENAERITKQLLLLWQSAHSALNLRDHIEYARHAAIMAKKLRFSTSKKNNTGIIANENRR